ncbi:hypothetical protein EP7_000569 [Isosphaeraceae bacterium EP7]
MEPPLQPLRIPAGWAVLSHDLREIDPSPEAFAGSWLREDLLHLRNGRTDVFVDVGWYPEGDPDGEYSVVVHRGDFRSERLHEYRTPNHLPMVAEVERLLLSFG